MATPTIRVTPAKLNFLVRKGSTLRRTLYWYTDTTQTTPVDLTDYAARMQLRDADGNLVFELTTEDGGITLGGAAGTITFFISDTDTEAMSSDDCVYDLELVDTLGDVVPFLAGSFTFQDQVTVPEAP